MYTPMPTVSKLEVITTGSRRRWTTEEKLRIVAESFSGPRLVSTTARRYGLSASQLFAWRRMARAGAFRDGVASFVPVVVADQTPASGSQCEDHEAAELENNPSAGTPKGRMQIMLSNGRQVIVGEDVDAAALARVIGVLDRR